MLHLQNISSPSGVIKLTTWNVKGLNFQLKRNKILNHLKCLNTNIAILQETHLKPADHLKVLTIGGVWGGPGGALPPQIRANRFFVRSINTKIFSHCLILFALSYFNEYVKAKLFVINVKKKKKFLLSQLANLKVSREWTLFSFSSRFLQRYAK